MARAAAGLPQQASRAYGNKIFEKRLFLADKGLTLTQKIVILSPLDLLV